jgi:hypothetical protein
MATVAGDGKHLDALRMNTSWGDFRADPALDPPMMKVDGLGQVALLPSRGTS